MLRAELFATLGSIKAGFRVAHGIFNFLAANSSKVLRLASLPGTFVLLRNDFFNFLIVYLYSGMAYFTSSSRTTTGEFRSSMKKQMSREVRMIHPHDLAKDLHSLVESFLLLDCRPILAYNSCHITGKSNTLFV